MRKLFEIGWATATLILLTPVVAAASPWWRGEWQEEFWDGPCEVKLESKRGEFKREIKCPDGAGATWHGEWKREF